MTKLWFDCNNKLEFDKSNTLPSSYCVWFTWNCAFTRVISAKQGKWDGFGDFQVFSFVGDVRNSWASTFFSRFAVALFAQNSNGKENELKDSKTLSHANFSVTSPEPVYLTPNGYRFCNGIFRKAVVILQSSLIQSCLLSIFSSYIHLHDILSLHLHTCSYPYFSVEMLKENEIKLRSKMILSIKLFFLFQLKSSYQICDYFVHSFRPRVRHVSGLSLENKNSVVASWEGFVNISP